MWQHVFSVYAVFTVWRISQNYTELNKKVHVLVKKFYQLTFVQELFLKTPKIFIGFF
jgi:hypothetical protein